MINGSTDDNTAGAPSTVIGQFDDAENEEGSVVKTALVNARTVSASPMTKEAKVKPFNDFNDSKGSLASAPPIPPPVPPIMPTARHHAVMGMMNMSNRKANPFSCRPNPHPLQQQPQSHFHQPHTPLSMPTTQVKNGFTMFPFNSNPAMACADPSVALNPQFNNPMALTHSQQRSPHFLSQTPTFSHQPPIYTPSEYDVLFGRGGAVNTHKGNVYFRSLVTDYHPEYVYAKNHAEKGAVVQKILKKIREKGGRFLRRPTPSMMCGGDASGASPKFWYAVEERDATVKTMQTLRDVKGFDGLKWNSGPSAHATAATVKSQSKENTESSIKKEERDDVGNSNGDSGNSVGDSSVNDVVSSSVHDTSSTRSQSHPLPVLSPSCLDNKKRSIANTGQQPSSSSQIHLQKFKRLKHDMVNQGMGPLNSSLVAMSLSKSQMMANINNSSHLPYFNKMHPMMTANPNHLNTNININHASNQQYGAITTSQLRSEDVLSGRGGGTNRHPGNIHFRSIVAEAQPVYAGSRKRDKSDIAKNIVKKIRDNRGRFLKLNDDTGLWYDVGDYKAREKASQALREGLAGEAYPSTKSKNRVASNESSEESNQGAKGGEKKEANLKSISDKDHSGTDLSGTENKAVNGGDCKDSSSIAKDEKKDMEKVEGCPSIHSEKKLQEASTINDQPSLMVISALSSLKNYRKSENNNKPPQGVLFACS